MINLSVDEFLSKIKSGNLSERYCLFICGTYLNALAFNLIFNPYNIVSGGTSGLSVIFKSLFSINPSLFSLLFPLIVLIVGYFTLGKDSACNTVIGVFLYPVFLYATRVYGNAIDLGNTSMFALMIYGGVLSGFANGLIIKTGFSLGGTQTLSQIVNKYFGVSIGNANLFINSLIVIFGGFVFGVVNAIYAIIALYISSIIMDKVILGISDCKAFYIITNKDIEVRDYIINNLHHSVTLLDARGGYSGNKLRVLLCVIPTREYIMVKNVISEIDGKAFYIITDSYEVLGGI